jgi:hypothetical protein
MELYNADNAAADIERIKEDVAKFYVKREAAGDIQNFEVKAGYVNMNHFWATCEYLPTKDGERFGPITAHFTILILNGEIKYQN